MMTFKLAWRNLLRNRRRTVITMFAVGLTTTILVASFSLFEGMRRQMVRSATRLVVGEAQAHHPNYREERSFYDAIRNPQKILEAADDKGILASPRSYGYGLTSKGRKSAGAMFIGIDPARERQTFELSQELKAGSFLDSEPNHRVVIGGKLAKSLHAQVGSELVAVVQAADGSLGNDLFVVQGILKGISEEIDRTGVLMHRASFEELFVSDGRIHEIAFRGPGRTPKEVVSALAPVAPDTEMVTWREVLPTVSDMVNMSGAAIYLFAFIFFLAAGLGVLNTMLMATHDRVREFGVLKAIGATPWRIIRDVSAEGSMLAVVASGLGLVPGVLLAVYFQHVGIDLSVFGDATFSFSGIAWDPIWRGYLTTTDLLVSFFTMWLACWLASLYPAMRAAKLDPARAMTQV